MPYGVSFDNNIVLPATVMFNTPPPHPTGQGEEFSCVAWAVAYGLSSKSYRNAELGECRHSSVSFKLLNFHE